MRATLMAVPNENGVDSGMKSRQCQGGGVDGVDGQPVSLTGCARGAAASLRWLTDIL